MDSRKASHDILNILERMRIMHEIVKNKNYGEISKEEVTEDLASDLKRLEESFKFLMDQ